MQQRVQLGGLAVAASLHSFIEEEALPAAGIDSQTFWDGADAVIHDLAPRNRELLARRDELQARIDEFHREHPGVPDAESYTAFLTEIGYLLDEPADFELPRLDGDVRECRPERHHSVLQRLVRDQLVDGRDVVSVENLVEVALDHDLRRLRSTLTTVHVATVRPARWRPVRIA